MSAKFDAHSTAEEVSAGVYLAGKHAIITGGYAGIGRETSRVFALRGAHVHVAGRDVTKCLAVVEELKKETGNQNIYPLELDLASFASIRKCAEAYNQLNFPIHFLILNAAVMACPYSKTKEGFEMQFGTNFLGHFLLTQLLLPKLIQGAPAQVVSVSSSAHWLGWGVHFEDINFENRTYNPWASYGQSKTASILFAVEFNRRYNSQGVRANSLHPGRIRTDLQRHVQKNASGTTDTTTVQSLKGFKEATETGMEMKTVHQGAATSVYVALLDQSSDGGKYYVDCAEFEAAPFAIDPEIAKKLWDVAETMIGVVQM